MPEGRSSDRQRRIYLPPWRIEIVSRAGTAVPIATASLARAAAAALSAAGAPSPASLGLILTDDRELTALNEEHMDERGPTDVLSFPLLQPSAFPSHPGQSTDARDTADHGHGPGDRRFALPRGRRVHLGDIVVSVDRAAEQAAEGRGGQTGDVRWSVGDELRLLAIHGTLHVCGWDHAEPAEERHMRELERRLLGAEVR